MDWSDFRRSFPVTDSWAYMDHAAVSPLPACARAALLEWADDVTANGTIVDQGGPGLPGSGAAVVQIPTLGELALAMLALLLASMGAVRLRRKTQ